MKIAFITAGLEPGKDGVGDYTRRLAGECILRGHQCRLIALNDRYKLNAETRQAKQVEVSSDFQEWQECEGSQVECLRLPVSQRWPEHAELARRWLEDFQPDWVSLQYVCYGYHPKGLAWKWNKVFTELGGLTKHRHLMFHELWIDPPPYYRRFIGRMQRAIIRHLYKSYKPELVTTSMTFYQQRLIDLGIKATVLPLFSNIPLARGNGGKIVGLLQAAGSQIAKHERETFVTGVNFATIHPDFKMEALVKWLVRLQKQSGKPILLSLIGRTGNMAATFVKRINSLNSKAFEAVILGECVGETISQMLQFADFGISTGSSVFLGKSGTVAAMREHGLPVVTADGELDNVYHHAVPPVWRFSDPNAPVALLEYRRGSSHETQSGKTAGDLLRLMEKESRAAAIAMQLAYS
jgi:hypothetical protein